MVSRLLNLIFLMALIVCTVFLIRTVKEYRSPAVLPSVDSNSSVMLEVPRVEVSASESKKFAADKFEMGFRLELRGKDKETVFKLLGDRRTVIFDNVKSLDIPRSDVEQNSVDVRKEWSYRSGKRELVGYVATQEFSITVGNKADAAALVQALSSEPDVEISRTAALLKDAETVQSAMIKEASKKAMRKAKDYAEGVGANLGRVLQVNGDGGSVFYNPARRRMNGLFLAKGVMAESAPAPDESAIADSVEVSASAHIVVELK